MPPAGSPPPRPKNTLFCQRCGHESPADGDWCVLAGEVYACPACGAVLTDRGVLDPPASSASTRCLRCD